MAVRETSGWSYAPYLFLCGYFGCLPQPHSGYLLFCSILQSIWSLCEGNPPLHSAFSCKVSGYVSMILDILFLFPIAVHTIQTALGRSLYENIFPMKDISFMCFFLIIPVRILFQSQFFIMMPFVVADIPEFGCCITHMPYDIGIFRPDFYRCSV